MGKISQYIKSVIKNAPVGLHEMCCFSERQTRFVLNDIGSLLRLTHLGEQFRRERNFEKEFSKRFAAKHARGVNSGTTALYLALKALDISAGQEVITVANTFVSTVCAIMQTGASVRFADINPVTGMMDPDSLAAAINENTAAVMPVHMYGAMADMRRIVDVAKRFKLAVVEDACQAIGASQYDRYAGTWGDIGCFSFHNSKLVGAPADGGMIVTKHSDVYRRLCRLAAPDWENVFDGHQDRVPARLPVISMPILKARLKALEESIRHRKTQLEYYMEHLADVDKVHFLTSEEGVAQSYRNAILICPNPEKPLKALRRKGILAEMIYPQSNVFVRSIESRFKIRLPNTRNLVSNHIALPIGRQVTPKMQNEGIAVVRKYYNGA